MNHEEAPCLKGQALSAIADEGMLEFFRAHIDHDEYSALLEACPDMLERMADIERDDFEGIPFDKVMQDLGIAI